MPLNLAIFVSGRGSNLEAILKAIKNRQLDAKVHVVISNRPDALALKIARDYGVHAVAIDNKGLSREEHERLVLEELQYYELDYIVLAGYMRVLSAGFVSRFKDRLINIHPSLLPDFPGTAGYDEAFAAGVPESGITVHLVDEEVDHGPILAQERFPRLPDDTLETFKARGLAVEHKIYPAVLQRLAKQQNQICCAVVPRESCDRFPLYWVEFKEEPEGLEEALKEVLVDPLLSDLIVARRGEQQEWIEQWRAAGVDAFAQKQHQPGVTDNLGKTVQEALRLAGIDGVEVASGECFLFQGYSPEEIEELARYHLYHPLTERFVIDSFLSFPEVHLPEPEPPETIPLDISDEELVALSRQRVLALSLEEMRAIRDHFAGMSRWPTDVELEVIAQTWSEHCKHKIFSARVNYENKETGEKQEINSLYKTYIQGATKKLCDPAEGTGAPKRFDLLSVFEDNAGVVKWNDDWAVCFKVETHNSPSALEPYGGALTGILGVNRDILGTGLGARPIFNTDVFCFAYPSENLPNRPTMLPADAIMRGVRQGVQDGGNKSGIPTVNGAIVFDDGYRAKPLVYCGTGGLLPLSVQDKVGYKKYTKVGDTIVMAGGRVGKDGIHGATFSSEALHEGSPVSAVQIGDPFTQKRLSDFILEARDRGLITGITDNGAGGLSSSVGEMAQITGGALLALDNIPLKYPGLADYEIVISESQERMTLSTDRFEELKELAENYNVEVTACGVFTDTGNFKVTRNNQTVADLDLNFLHKGCPQLQLDAVWESNHGEPRRAPSLHSPITETLLDLMASPNICSREEVIRQYDHEVQATSVIKPLMGPEQIGPCDAAVIKPLPDDNSGLVISNGICPWLSKFDTYLMAVCAVDEAVRNAVCVGADPASISLLDNFCWTDPVPSPRNSEAKYKMAQLVRACQGLYDAVIAYGTPLISGKDSMKNDFDDGTLRLSIPPTLLVSAIGRVPHVAKAVTMEFKRAGDVVFLLSAGKLALGGSEVARILDLDATDTTELDLELAEFIYKGIHEWITAGGIKSAHDCSEGGLGVALAECVIGSGLGFRMDNDSFKQILHHHPEQSVGFALFAERPGTLIVSVAAADETGFATDFKDACPIRLGEVTGDGILEVAGASIYYATLKDAWTRSLPFDDEVTDG